MHSTTSLNVLRGMSNHWRGEILSFVWCAVVFIVHTNCTPTTLPHGTTLVCCVVYHVV
jgi:hypothetical protein